MRDTYLLLLAPALPIEYSYALTMSLKSDLTIDATKFDRKLADKETEEFNEKLIKIWADGPRWYEVWQLALQVRAGLSSPGWCRGVPKASMGGQDTTSQARCAP